MTGRRGSGKGIINREDLYEKALYGIEKRDETSIGL
jgi:hypothetical protein